MLFILDRKNEVVGSLNSNGDLSKIATYFDDEYVQDLGTGAETFKFSTLADNEQSKYLVVGNSIAFKHDGDFKLFTIIQIEETHEDTFIKTVYCEMAGIELINEIIRPMKVLNSSLRKFLTSILEGTEWQLGILDTRFTDVHDFEITDYQTVYELIQEYAVGTYGAEISYRVEIAHGQIVGKYIDCYYERGKSDGFRFAYGSNLTSVTKTVDMSNIATALIGVGKNNITFKEVDTPDKPLNQDFIENKDAFKRWNVNGSHIFGTYKADTDSPHELLKLTRIALEERANPQIKYEMKVELLGREVKIGDTVYVVDHEFNPPLHLSARVNQLTTSKTNPYDDEIVLANFKEVNSNITSEMRQLASQLEGYVDSQFPIGGDKIQDGAIGKEQFSKQYHNEIIADAVYASMVEVGEIVATKADIEQLNAINAVIKDLQAENVTITGTLDVINANIENLKAENVEINGSLTANSASIKDLYANKASVGELHATKAEIETLKANKIDVSQLNATKAEIETLIAKKANIESLNALHGEIKVLESSKANISDLNAVNATIGSLQVNKADIIELNAVKGTITQLESEVAEIGTLKSDVADINELLAGNITAENIASGTITAGSGIIANGAIGSAQISEIDASKINAGTVDTSKVTIQGTDGHLKLKGNRLQVFTGTGSQAKERVSLGDVNGNGTIYGLRVRGADGQTILLDENGVTREGITDGSINNSKISDDANIDGAKLNINSVISKINEDGTETIQGTKIEVDGTTLNTKLSTITNKQTEDSQKITQAQSQITANTNAIKLKVDEQTYTADKKDMTSKLNKNTSEISAMKGQIALKVEQSDIENAKAEVEDKIDAKVNTAKAEIKVTTDKISQNITNLSQTVSNKADGSTVTAINNKVGSLETSVNGINGKVTNLEKTTTNLGSSVNGVKGEVETLKSDVASLEVTTSGISQKVSSVESTTVSLSTQVVTAQNTANQAKTDASSANSKVDNLQIGGRNYVLKSDDYITGNTNKNFDFSILQELRGKKVTVSVEVELNKAVGSRVGFEPSIIYADGSVQYLGVWQSISSSTTMKKRISATHTIHDKEIKSYSQRGIYIQGVTSGTARIGRPKLEIGTKFTDWTPAPEDIQTQLDANKTEISSTKSKVASIETNLDGITQRVSSTESTTATLTSKVNTAQSTANQAQSTANTANTNANQAKTDANTANSNATNALNTANSANSKIDGLEIGGKNLIPTSNDEKTYAKDGSIIVSKTNNFIKVLKNTSSTSSNLGVWKDIVVEPNTKYTISLKVGHSDSGKLGIGSFINENSVWSHYGYFDFTANKLFTKTFTTKSGETKIRLFIAIGPSAPINSYLEFINIKIEKGTKATDWTPAPEDIQTQLDANKTEISSTKSKVASIETNLNGITSRVTNVETAQTTANGKVTSLESRMTTAENKITDKAIINTVSSTIDSKVDTGIKNIQIGDRNLLLMENVVNRDSKNFTKDGYTTSFTHSAEYQGVQINNLRETMELGKEYCLQYKIKKIEGSLLGISHHCDAQFEVIDFVVDNKLQNATAVVTNMNIDDNNWHNCILRVKRKTDATGDSVNRIIPQPNRGKATSVTVEMKDFKISQGNKFGDWTPAPEDVEKQISNTETMLNGNIDNAVSGAKTEILNDVSKNYAKNEKVTQLQEVMDSKFEQTSKNMTMQFSTAQNYTKEVDGKLQNFQNTVATHIRFSENGIDLGKTNSVFTATLDNTKLAFKQSGEEIAYISNNKMYITQAEIKETLRIGKSGSGFFSWVQGTEGNLSLKWSES